MLRIEGSDQNLSKHVFITLLPTNESEDMNFKVSPKLLKTEMLILLYTMYLRGVLFIFRAGNDVIKADFMHTKRSIFSI